VQLLSGASPWEALLFSLVAYGLPLLLGWWLFGSKLNPARPLPAATATPTPVWIPLLLGLTALFTLYGGVWDGVQHVETGAVVGGADFLWPPHLLIYTSYLVAFVVALAGLARLAGEGARLGVRDPRIWVRRNPYLGAVVLACLYSLLSVPGDAIWHEIFVDLHAWTPPHIMLALTSYAVLVSALGLLVGARATSARPRLLDLAGMTMLGTAAGVALLVGVLEWELPGPRAVFVAARPIWLYPVVFAVVYFITLVVARTTLPRWSATGAAVLGWGVKVATLGVLHLAGHLTTALPLITVGGALLLDAVPWERIQGAVLRSLAMSAAYAAGFVACTVPLLLNRPDIESFTARDIGMTFVVTMVAGVVLLPVAQWAGLRMARAGGRAAA
jgi:hypothetical protein